LGAGCDTRIDFIFIIKILKKQEFPEYQNRYYLEGANIQKFIIPFFGQYTAGVENIEELFEQKGKCKYSQIYIKHQKFIEKIKKLKHNQDHYEYRKTEIKL